MKIVFLSNELNHHQFPLGESFNKLNDVDFKFIATEPIAEERIKLGYKNIDSTTKWCIRAYLNKENEKEAYNEFLNADIGIFGMVDDKYKYIFKARLKSKKIIFLFHERLYRTKLPLWQIPLRMLKYFFKYYIHKNEYVLCAGAFVSYDFSRTYNFKGKCYKWGYFPIFNKLDIDNIEKLNNYKKIKILWAGRLIPLKHVESLVFVAKKLKANNINFEINIVGQGVEYNNIEKMINENDLNDYIKLLGSVSSDSIRILMEGSHIFLFTSDRREGWGVVLNESMNSCCVPVCSSEIGSAPYLIKEKYNGLIFESENWDELSEKVLFLCKDTLFLKQLAFNAYKTIENEWNSDNAAKKAIILFKKIMQKEETPFTNDLCSKAEIIKDGWYKR